MSDEIKVIGALNKNHTGRQGSPGTSSPFLVNMTIDLVNDAISRNELIKI